MTGGGTPQDSEAGVPGSPGRGGYFETAGGASANYIARWDADAKRAGWIYDYNGDGTSDIAIFRSGSGLWAVRGVTRAYFGGAADLPAPGYYEGSGRKNTGIFRGSSGLWAANSVIRLCELGSCELGSGLYY